MSFVAAATSVGTWAGFTSATGALIGGSAIIGAGVGGAYSALTGDGNILDSMLTGAGIGGLGGWGLSAAGLGGAAGAGGAGTAAGGVGAGGATTAAEVAASQTPATFAYNSAGEMVPANYAADITGATNLPEPFMGPPDSAKLGFFERLTPKEMLGYGLGATTLLGLLGGKEEGIVPVDKGNIRPYEYTASRREPEAGKSYYFEPIQYDQYGKTTKPLDTSERNYFNQKFTPLPTYKAALGGQVPQLNNMPAGGLAAIQGMREGYAPMTTVGGDIPQFADGGYTYDPAKQRYKEITPQVTQAPRRRNMIDLLLSGVRGDEAPQSFGNPLTDPLAYDIGRQYSHLFSGLKMPQAEQQVANRYKYDPSAQQYEKYANGGMAEGDLGGYSDGGRLLRGPGDGVSDDIPATINNKQPARLADGEFVIPARIVSEIGNGSTDAGAKRLYEMMDRIQSDRKKTVGKGKVAVDSKAKKRLLA